MIGAPFTPWAPLLAFVMATFGFIATVFVIYLIVDGMRRRQQLRSTAEFQSRLLERIGSTREFGDFLNTPEGERFLLAITPREKSGPRIFRTVQTAVVALFVGVAIFIYTNVSGSIVGGAGSILNLIAAVLTAAGLALGLSTAIALIWSKRLGVVESGRDEGRSEPSRL